MKIPYPRPRKLSDPHSDFTKEHLRELLATPDEELEWHHLRALLGPFLPAGTYTESVYFLPFALQALDDGEDALDLTSSVCWFLSEYADELARDGLLDECRSKIESCLQHGVAAFSVVHFNREACAAKGWGLRYFDSVHRSEVICGLLCDLDRFARHADLADRFIARLASSDDPVAAGWFLELARAQEDVYHPPHRASFQRYLTDPALLVHKRSLVQEHLAPTTASPTYWNDVFRKLGG